MKRVGLLSGIILLCACVASATGVYPAAPDSPVVPGQWHSNLAAAEAKAKELGAPMLVLWGDPGCAYCNDFDTVLTNDVCVNYLAGRGIVMVYEKSSKGLSTDIKEWTGYGDWPLLRVTWWKDGWLAADLAWQRPNPEKHNFTRSFSNFKTVLESQIGSFIADPSKDRFDPANDAGASAPALVWKDQYQSETLKLAKSTTAPYVYTDTNDWFRLPVEAGKTYLISVANVAGVAADAPTIALYGDAEGTAVIGAPVALAQGDFEFVPVASGTVFVKVSRSTFTDESIQYTLKYKRRAAGQVEFVAGSVAVPEKAASVTLTLRRVGGTSGPAKVTIGFQDSLNSSNTATAGQDFNGTPSVLTWADGDAANKTVTVPLLKTVALWEGDETFVVPLLPDALMSPELTVGAPAVVTLQEVDAFNIATRNPQPASGSVKLSRDLGVFSWEDVIGVEADTTGKRLYNVYAGASASLMSLIAGNLPAAELNMATNALFQAILAKANAKPTYWRVDSVYTGGLTPSITKGPAWTVSVLPTGSPEFVEGTDAQVELYVGVQVNKGRLVFVNGMGGTLSVGPAANGGSLPSGLKLEIRNGNEVWLAGLPTRAAIGSVLVQIRTKIGLVTYPGTTVRLNYRVSALPSYAAGAYQGWVGDLGGSGVLGTINLSVSSAGRMSGKAVFPTGAEGYSGTYAFAATSYQALSNDTAWITGNLTRTGAPSVPVQFGVSVVDGRVLGALGAPGDLTPVALFRNNWGAAGMPAFASQFAGYYTAAFPVLMSWPDDAPKGSGYATFTLDARGGFKMAGKLADGSQLLQSGTLFVETDGAGATNVCAFLYSAPTAYKGGLFGGVVCFGDLNTNGVKDIGLFDNAPLQWRNLNPLAVPAYDSENPGFDETLSVSGGWYNKLANLQAFYAGRSLFVGDLSAPPEISYLLTLRELDDANRTVTTVSQESAMATSWQSVTNVLTVTPKADGSGFTLPAADLKLLGVDEDGMPLYNYESAVNPNGVKMTFNRATGLLSGSFNPYYDYATVDDITGDTEKLTWAHTAKLCSYACVLLPERVASGDGIEADGYYLFGSSSTYETPTGLTRPYSFNYSFDFTLESEMLPEEQ